MKRKLLIAVLVLVLCVAVFAACGKDENKEPVHLDPVNADTIVYDGDTLSWGAVDNAECYWVYVDTNENYYVAQENNLSLRLSQDVTFYVLSVANNSDYISAETKSAASFTYIPMVESIGVEKRTADKIVGANLNTEESIAAYDSCFDHFTWNAIEKADAYMLKENGSSETVQYQPDENSGVLKQPIGATFDSEGGVASLSILPVSDTARTYSHWSDVKTVTVLADPANFAYNREADLISWSAVGNVKGYEVKVGTKLEDLEWVYSSGNHYVYGENVKNFKSAVKAIGDIENDVLDSRLVERSYQQLADLEGLTVEFGELKWTPSPVASEYQVRISVQRVDANGEEYTQNLVETVVNQSQFGGTYEAFYNEEKIGGVTKFIPCTYTAMVRPVIASTEAKDVVSFANWSEKSFNLLKTPTIKYNGGETFSWDSIAGASGYNVWLYRNGVSLDNVVRTEDNQLKYEYDFSATSGTYELKVAALSGNGDESVGTNASRKSEAFVIEVLSAPTEYTCISSTYDIQSGASQTTDDNTEQSEMNFFFNDVYGADYYVVSHHYDFKWVDTDGDGEYDIVSDGSDGSTKVVKQTIDYRSTVGDDAKKGDYQVNVNSIIADETGRTDTIYLYAKSSLVGKYVEYVQLGDNTYGFREASGVTNMILMDGDDSTPVQITKLASPTGVKLEGNVLYWNKVSRSSAYEVKVVGHDGQGKFVNDLSFVQEVYSDHYTLQFPAAGQYNIYVKALGNGDIILDSVYGSPVSVIKLPKITGLKVEDNAGHTSLMWSASSFTFNNVSYNAQGYEVRIGDTVLSRVNNNHVDLEGFKQFFTSGKGAYCTVTALGDNVKMGENELILLDADKSSSITVFKLARPLNLVVQSNVLAWSTGDRYARKYRVYEGDDLLGETTATTFDFLSSDKFKGNKAGKDCSFRVVAMRDDYKIDENDGIEQDGYFVDSEDSATLSISMLATPAVTVAKDTGEAVWEKVSGASSYLVKVSEMGDQGAVSTMSYNVNDMTDSDVVKFTPTVLSASGKTVRISVCAVGNNLTYFNSYEFYYSTKVEQLAKVNLVDGKAFTVSVHKNSDGVSDYLTIQVSEALNENEEDRTKGAGYYVNIGGVDHKVGKDGVLKVENLSVGEYEIKVCARGGNYQGEVVTETDTNTMYISSEYIGGFKFTVLGAPSARDVAVSYGGLQDVTKRLVTFAEIPDAIGYKLTYTYYKLLDATAIDEEEKYEEVAGGGTMTLMVGSNTSVSYVNDEEDTVCFVISGIAAEGDGRVDVVKLVIQTLGDDALSTSNQLTEVNYNVR